MSRENLEVVERAEAALSKRDIDSYLACCAEDIRVWAPWGPVEGIYEGQDGVRRFWADIEAALPDLRVTVERMESIGSERVVAFLRSSARARASGVPVDLETANVYDLADGRITGLRIFADREEALEAARVRE
jgi:ketosteroid isomerase-like protein